MTSKMKVKTGDQVMVMTGKDKGKTGEIKQVFRKESRVIVEGANMVKRHQKQSQTAQSGIVSKEASLHVSNVAHIDPKDNKPTRVGYKMDGDRKVRFAKRSGEVID
ncbi:50S ribosomal protein L24 [Alphaproteobacteria bacterium]|jgi:large subunit ribosomal protein L24|nr:50S ribosomal protein L24 [Alphaproteobacteria bacterium]